MWSFLLEIKHMVARVLYHPNGSFLRGVTTNSLWLKSKVIQPSFSLIVFSSLFIYFNIFIHYEKLKVK